MKITKKYSAGKPLTRGALAYAELVQLCAGKYGQIDVACPLCGPGRRAPVNRERKVLRIWHAEPGFASFHCARCGESGYGRDGGARPTRPVRLKKISRKAHERDRQHALKQQVKANTLWHHRKPLAGSAAETYLREARGYGGPLPPTLGFLPPFRSGHHPAMVAAFDIPVEKEPGILRPPEFVPGVHLTILRPDGSGKADTKPDKLMVGPSNGWPVVLAPMSDFLALIICEGIETGLSLHEATGCGVWAAGAAGRMPALADKVPDYVDCVTIAAEPDDAGRKGATELARRLKVRRLHCELRILGDQEARAA